MKRSHWSWWENTRTNPRSTLEVYKKTLIFIPVYITEDMAKSVARKLSGSSGPGGTDSEDLQGWILKFGEHSKRLCSSVETFVEWISTGSPPWTAYCAFMSGRLTTLDKQPDVRPVRVGEKWRQIFDKCVMRVTGPEATSACQDDHIV